MTDGPIRVLLDASAIIAYTRGSVDVGEPMSEVLDEGATVGLPMLCLAEAYRQVPHADLIDVLLEHEVTRVIGPAPEQWRILAVITEIVGQLDAASAVVAANSFGVAVLTAQPGLYGGLKGGGPIIPVV